MLAETAKAILSTMGMDHRVLDRHCNPVDPLTFHPELRDTVLTLRRSVPGFKLGKPRSLLRLINSRVVDPEPDKLNPRCYRKPL